MAKIYGDRWETQPDASLGEGGQGHIFRVIDLRGEHGGEFALKRIRNPARLDRFSAEIEAVKRLDHPNIIKLIDHSALEAEPNGDRQFLVMPVAAGGDLSKSDRLSLYADAMDAVLRVAMQIADGLRAAHAAGVIHRDVKPENILFVGRGHEIWISDFGICLLRERPRLTEDDEVVGPRAFMAPELEEGGQLDVSPAVDVYSLGKLIYYMISGGTRIPRERLHEERYRRILEQTERQRLLRLLLDQMICSVDHRLRTMDEVLNRLKILKEWEQTALTLPIGEAGRASIERLQRHALDTQRILSDNAAARDQERATLTNVAESIRAWLRAELEKAVAQINGGNILACESGELSSGNENWNAARRGNRWYAPLLGLELRLEVPGDPFARKHLFQIRLCQEGGVSIQVNMAGGFPAPAPAPARDPRLAIIPYYQTTLPNQRRMTSSGPSTRSGHFLSKKSVVGTTRRVLVQSPARPQRRLRGMQPSQRFDSVRIAPAVTTFDAEICQCIEFSASEWPSMTEALRTMLDEAIEVFLGLVSAHPNHPYL